MQDGQKRERNSVFICEGKFCLKPIMGKQLYGNVQQENLRADWKIELSVKYTDLFSLSPPSLLFLNFSSNTLKLNGLLLQ